MCGSDSSLEHVRGAEGRTAGEKKQGVSIRKTVRSDSFVGLITHDFTRSDQRRRIVNDIMNTAEQRPYSTVAGRLQQKPATSFRGRRLHDVENQSKNRLHRVFEFLRNADHLKKTLWHISRTFQSDRIPSVTFRKWSSSCIHTLILQRSISV